MSSYNPPNPIPNPNDFNYNFFTHLEDGLTIEVADKRYLKLSGGSVGYLNVLTNLNVFGEYYKNSVLVNLDAITGVTNGTAVADKALILDSNRNINNINILSAQNIDIDNTNTTPFSLTGNSDLYGLHLHSNFTGTGQNYGCAISFNHSNTNQIPLSAIVLDKKAVATGDLVFYTRNGSATLQESMRLKSNGNLGVGVNNPLYQLDLGGAGTGINTGSLKFNDVTFNQDLYLNITSGSVEANKALVPNSDLDLGTFRNVDLSGTLTTNIINAQTYRLNSVDANISTLTNLTLGIAQPSKALTLDSFGNLQFDDGAGSGNSRNGTNALQWYGNTAFKEKILMYRPNDDSGLVIASNPSTIQKCSPLLWLYSGFDATGVVGTSSAEYREVLRSEHKLVGLSDNYRSGWFHGYLLGTQPWQTSGFGYCTQFYTSIGTLNISCNSSSTNSFASSNNLLLLNTGRMVYNSLTPFTNGTYGNASFTLNNSNLYIKTTSTFNDGSANYSMAMLLDGVNANPVRFAFQLHTGPASTSTNPAFLGTVSTNDLAFMTDNTRRMTLTAGGRLGIGVSTPSTVLDIAGFNLVTTTTNIAINTLSYNVSNNTWTNLGGGPVSVNMCARFRDSIWVQDKIYATSDRRLKTEITPLDFTLEHYNKLNPVSYKWKNNEKTMLGVIAQEVKNICAESITAIENPNMKKENEDDTEGYQLTVDYNCINMMNVVAIKKLIDKINILEKRINNLENNN